MFIFIIKEKKTSKVRFYVGKKNVQAFISTVPKLFFVLKNKWSSRYSVGLDWILQQTSNLLCLSFLSLFKNKLHAILNAQTILIVFLKCKICIRYFYFLSTFLKGKKMV